MFDINGGEFLILIVVALVILGPERLPQYAAQLGKLVREARGFASKAREQVRAEMGDEFDDVDWKALDPRRYDPRRIVREALLDGDDDPLGLSGWTSDSAPNVPANMRPPQGESDAAAAEPAESDTSVTGTTPRSYDVDAT
ncbi:twin-arginine translocase TatA/TatE family subunit [Angustibacter luteus]|uniref:Sec-independent protein translocase protein TatB n=1 Tax=Angustibacter luteus TaxID=658456 RepID=A0ABW1JHZ9_9ACTN